MPDLTFMVTVEVARDSGLHASRQDIADKIEEALNEAAQNADLSGLGPHGTSEYSVIESGATELDAKAAKAAWAESEIAVRAEKPTGAETRELIKGLRAEVDALGRARDKAEQALAQSKARGETDVYSGHNWEGERANREYLDPHTPVIFIIGDVSHRDYIKVVRKGEAVEVSSEGQLIIEPRISNIVSITRRQH